ncbi:MAG: NAD-dependent epimerase/dehydratase family protein [Lewinellaceae bacterium]|nr:NAD-dependent epimerase/dehydratase family protein [Saprospiraceae bacterium]MCB9311315.1 NAD-dependent epimerase/dehydratase family protein [Lewinellaceae bacterium]
MQQEQIIVTGAGGQIGQVLLQALAERYGQEAVIATDIRPIPQWKGKFVILNVLDRIGLEELVSQQGTTQIYHLAAILSASGEKDPLMTWQVNMDGLLNILETARTKGVNRVFYPSSIAVFGAGIDLSLAGQDVPLIPSTVYGMSKAAGENWGYYYFHRYGLDVRSLRYPGIIGYQSPPGGGTTDYAVDIFHYATRREHYTCFLKEDARLPMIYMEDAIRATLELMAAPQEQIRVRTSYNLAGMDFDPHELAASIQRVVPDFTVEYAPDFRQAIAASWPQRIDDSSAREDWGWRPAFDLEMMTRDMLYHLERQMTSGEAIH